MSALSAIIDEYIAATNAWAPVGASTRGFHEHEGRLGDRSLSALEGRMSQVRGFLGKLAAIDRASLSGEEPHEADLLERRLRWEITDFEEVRSWQRSPGAPFGMAGSACNSLIIRDFAPLDDRLRWLVARLDAVPAIVDQIRANLADPSRYHVETAIEAGAGIRALFTRDLQAAAGASGDGALKRSVGDAAARALSSLDAYTVWLKSDLLPKAHEDFAWGPDAFRKLLSETDSIDDPLESLIARCEEDLRAHIAMLHEVAAKIDASAEPAAVVDEVSKDHPDAGALLPHVDGLLEDLRQFSIDAKLCTMPTDVRIAMKETPGFARMTTQAACSTPGPFETKAKEAYYYVTPPGDDWPAERTESYLKFFNRWSIPGVTAHEAYPGHYVHLTYLHRATSKLGKYLMSITPIEGWAHYVEQLMVEHAYGGGDPRYHLMQIREALLRLCRYRCAFGLHAEGWSVPQAVEFFVKQGYATPIISERETRRGVIGPNYYAYTMGKHQILSLRDKLRARDGASFDERAFHDTFMQYPYPVATIEKIMLA